MLIQAFDLINKIDIWENSIPPHWRKQYHNENIPGAVSTLADPWTTTFLAVTHSAQILFYQHVIALCDEMIMREPTMETHIQLRKTAADRINAPLEVVCFAVASSIGELDTNGQFHARPTAQFGNNNTLVWPMWLALTCPFSTPRQKALCQRGLDYIGNTLGHKLASSLHQQACTVPMISTSIPIQPP
ncbi:hypothetical protein N7528_004666 [Penicillium herquei]|nr:hypothetical protein N7528_004666 [Penicillium herquei]